MPTSSPPGPTPPEADAAALQRWAERAVPGSRPSRRPAERPAKGTTMRPQRRGVVMTVIGAVMLIVVAPAAAVIGFVYGLHSGMDKITGAPLVAAGQAHHLSAGASATVFGYSGADSGGTGVSTNGGALPASACSVS